ncbi:hypothetical protein GN958_ATG15131 [Phytophthora infestans]|uniref:Uncharacterized protein n=1 Tax=Phytophthora infestans TaxID=4787 RepID=A0A8S9UBK6_PHYIN|nr:hypothetical protein GN958_ATG15131 [Phytophthora infestans]
MDEVEEAGDGRDDGVTAVEAVVERETSIVRDTVETVETVEDAERGVCESAGEADDGTAVNDSTYGVVAVTEGDTPVDEDEEVF